MFLILYMFVFGPSLYQLLDGENMSCVCFHPLTKNRLLHKCLRFNKLNETTMIVLYRQRPKDKCTVCSHAMTESALWETRPNDFLRPEISSILWKLLSLPFRCRRRYMSPEFSMWSLEWCQKKWRVIFPKAPHRAQSHYRPCQIQLVTEFAAQERGEERQDGEGWGVAMKWISWLENTFGGVLIIKNEDIFTLKCTSAEDGQFYLLAWNMIRLAHFGESTEVKSFSLNERLDFRKNSPGRQSFVFRIWLS